MSAKTVALADDVRDVLARSTVAGTVLVLPPGQLERDLYARLDKALKAAGGKWDRKAGGHVFASDPTEILGLAAADGVVEKVIDRKQTLQFFETPNDIVDRMLEFVPRGGRMLEPSAGHGRIAFALAEIADGVVAVEIDSQNVAMLRANAPANVEVVESDFMEYAPGELFAAVVMNPPFTNGQDMEHIRSAFDHLAPGGVLVAICGAGAFFREDKQAKAFRAWMDRHVADSYELDAGAFKESGTNVATRLVVIDRANNHSPATNDTDEENTTVPAPPNPFPELDQEVQEGVGSLAQCSGLVAGEETK